MNLLTLNNIGAAIAEVATSPAQFLVAPRNACIQANFTYDSGGTTVDAYVQTSLDGGSTWCDIAQFHFTTASARKVFNLNSQTPETTQVTPTDGTMSANTAQDGVLGTRFRVKYVTTGTYGGASSLVVSMHSDQVG